MKFFDLREKIEAWSPGAPPSPQPLLVVFFVGRTGLVPHELEHVLFQVLESGATLCRFALRVASAHVDHVLRIDREAATKEVASDCNRLYELGRATIGTQFSSDGAGELELLCSEDQALRR